MKKRLLIPIYFDFSHLVFGFKFSISRRWWRCAWRGKCKIQTHVDLCDVFSLYSSFSCSFSFFVFDKMTTLIRLRFYQTVWSICLWIRDFTIWHKLIFIWKASSIRTRKSREKNKQTNKKRRTKRKFGLNIHTDRENLRWSHP